MKLKKTMRLVTRSFLVKMRIKKHKNNEYIHAGGVWVRNFTKPYTKACSLSNMVVRSDHHLMMNNEGLNTRSGFGNIAEEKNIRFQNILILSDGHDFNKVHKELLDFPEDVFIMAVNGSLRNWKLTPRSRSINSYVVNNPYAECLTFMPHRESPYFPTCVSSVRTCPEFTKKYAGNLFIYEPVPEMEFGVKPRSEKYYIDDYRNPVCAAIGLAYQFGVKKLMLMCCDDSFAEKRDASVQLENNLWTYPQQVKSHDIINANLYWLTHDGQDKVTVADYSSGPKYKNATYISCKDEALAFFEEESMEDANDKTSFTT